MTHQDDDLRARLAGLDPVPATEAVDPSTSPRARELLERVMLTTEQTDTVPTPSWRKPAVLAAAAAAVVALGVGAVMAGGGSSGPAKQQTTLALKAPAESGGGPSMNSCLMFSVDILKDMPLAFAGTVTSIDTDTVTLDVDRWFKGGSADVVTVAVPPGNTSVGTVEFGQGSRYLVTATEGTVNSCGYTAEATPELERSFEQAFTP